jgi:GNAT superfamily N-acetyltransferase
MTGDVTIRRVGPRDAHACVAGLAAVLVDCVEGGASVGFMQPLTTERAERFWRSVADGVARGERALLIAKDRDGRLLGTVQLVLALPDNQPHRADVAKMLVHRDARRGGVARRLLQAAEQAARDEGRTVLVLDAVTGGDAAHLYTSAGWTRVGDIPDYALVPDGAPCSTTFFYKSLDRLAI